MYLHTCVVARAENEALRESYREPFSVPTEYAECNVWQSAEKGPPMYVWTHGQYLDTYADVFVCVLPGGRMRGGGVVKHRAYHTYLCIL